MKFSIWLLHNTNDYYYNKKWQMYLSHLVIHILLAIVYNVCSVIILEALYNIKSGHFYVFLCLLFESICGIHYGKYNKSKTIDKNVFKGFNHSSALNFFQKLSFQNVNKCNIYYKILIHIPPPLF